MLKLDQVSKYYRSPETVTQALRRVSLSMHAGEFVVITGESGSGKSTLLNVISGLDTYEEGELYINGEETSYFTKEDWEYYRSQYIGFIFQNYNIIDAYTVYQNVLAALIIQGYAPDKRKERAMELIEKVGLKDQAHQKSSTLSGGQKQRVSIARALAKDAPIIVADEPTGNLDKESGKRIIALLKEVSQEKLVIMVTHSFDHVKDHATRRIRLFDGEINEDKVLKPQPEKNVKPSTMSEGMLLKEQLYIAFKNLLSAPKRLVLTMAISLFIVAIFSLAYGSYVQSSASPNQFTFGSYLFNNHHESRIIAYRYDNQPFSELELNQIQALPGVSTVVLFDPLLDMYLYSETDFVSFNPLPSAVLSTRDLREGRFPQSINEIVVPSQSDLEVGDRISLNLNTYPRYGWWDRPDGMDPGMAVVREFEVVGVYRAQTVRYAIVHDDFFTEPIHQIQTLQGAMNDIHFELILSGTRQFLFGQTFAFIIDNQLDDNTIVIAQNLATKVGLDPSGEHAQITFKHPFITNPNPVSVTLLRDTNTSHQNTLTLSETTLLSLYQSEIKQISIIAPDALRLPQTMTALENQHPEVQLNHLASFEPTWNFDLGIFGRVMSTIGIIMLLLAMYFITYLSLRNIMQSRKKDYVIFRSIGASKRDLNRITLIELILVFSFAASLVYLGLFINALIPSVIPNFLNFYTFTDYLFAFILLLALAVLLGLRFNKHIFQDSVITALRVE